MAEKRLSTIDADTGEVLNHVLVAVPQKLRNAFNGGWVAMNLQTNAISIFKEIHDIEQQRVFWALIEKLDFENYINIVQADIARDLKMQRQNVNRAIKELIDLEVIIKGPKIGRNVTYRFNPNLGWRGSAKNHYKALKETAKEKAEKSGLKVVKGGKTTKEI